MSSRDSKSASAVLQLVPLSRIDDHPQHCRLVFREDVIDAIAAGLDGGYPQQYAIHVRPVGDRFETLSGHHRRRGAKKAGLKEIWAWVESLDDEAAHMALATSNAQGELSPLEIGLHARRAVPLEKGGRGKKGGMAEYARRIGKQQGDVSKYRQAAEVFTALQIPIDQSIGFLDKAQHLAAIHAAPAGTWPLLAADMLAKSWNVGDTETWTAKVAAIADALEGSEWAAVFLPLVPVVERYLATKEFSSTTVASLAARATAAVAAITDATKDLEEVENRVETFRNWLTENTGGDSWDIRKIEAKEREIIAELRKGDDFWFRGDWREHIEALQDESVSLVLTDPPYGIEYQSDYRLDRRKSRKNERIESDSQDAFVETEQALLALLPKLKPNAHVLMFCHWSTEDRAKAVLEKIGLLIRGSLVWVKNNTGMGDPKTTFAPKHERILHAVKGSPVLFQREADVLEADRVTTDRHPTEKPVALLQKLISATTVSGEFVADPFGGVASTLVAAKELGRRYWGCEIDEEYHEAGERRLKRIKDVGPV